MKQQGGFILPYTLFGLLLILVTTLLALQPIKTSWRLMEDYSRFFSVQEAAYTDTFINESVIAGTCSEKSCVLKASRDHLSPISIATLLRDAKEIACTTAHQESASAHSSLEHSMSCTGALRVSDPTVIRGNILSGTLQLAPTAHYLSIDGRFAGSLKLEAAGNYKVIVAGSAELHNLTAQEDSSLTLISATDSIVVTGIDSTITLYVSARKGIFLPSGTPYIAATPDQQEIFERLIYYRDPLADKNS